jgi:hypothetical protein
VGSFFSRFCTLGVWMLLWLPASTSSEVRPVNPLFLAILWKDFYSNQIRLNSGLVRNVLSATFLNFALVVFRRFPRLFWLPTWFWLFFLSFYHVNGFVSYSPSSNFLSSKHVYFVTHFIVAPLMDLPDVCFFNTRLRLKCNFFHFFLCYSDLGG